MFKSRHSWGSGHLVMKQLGNLVSSDRTTVTSEYAAIDIDIDNVQDLSLAHGGKDRHPLPIPLKTYDETIGVLRRAVDGAKLGRSERSMGYDAWIGLCGLWKTPTLRALISTRRLRAKTPSRILSVANGVRSRAKTGRQTISRQWSLFQTRHPSIFRRIANGI
jgi:hypothetical protein